MPRPESGSVCSLCQLRLRKKKGGPAPLLQAGLRTAARRSPIDRLGAQQDPASPRQAHQAQASKPAAPTYAHYAHHTASTPTIRPVDNAYHKKPKQKHDQPHVRAS